jgi:hypothetical protein
MCWYLVCPVDDFRVAPSVMRTVDGAEFMLLMVMNHDKSQAWQVVKSVWPD